MRRRSRSVAHIVGSNAKALLTYQKPVAVSDGLPCGTVPVLWRTLCDVFGVWVESDTPHAHKCRCGSLRASCALICAFDFAGASVQFSPAVVRPPRRRDCARPCRRDLRRWARSGRPHNCTRLLTKVNIEKPTSAADMRFMPFQNVIFRYQFDVSPVSRLFDRFTTASRVFSSLPRRFRFGEYGQSVPTRALSCL